MLYTPTNTTPLGLREDNYRSKKEEFRPNHLHPATEMR